MTGKLFLALGDDYEFDPKRAKAVVEFLQLDENPITVSTVTLTRSGIPGNSGTVAVTGGPASTALQGAFWVIADWAGGVINQFVGWSAPSGATATQIGDAIAAALGGIEGILATNTAGSVAVSLQGAGTINALRMYMEEGGSGIAGGGGIPTPIPEPIVDGPNSSPHGEDYWLQRDALNDWYIWWDIDADPEPDIKQPLGAFLNNSSVNLQYRADVQTRAGELGWVA